jgi:hypothetical protein
MQISKPGFFSRGKLILAPSPDLTVDMVHQELSQGYAQGKYEVYKTALLGADLVIKQSGWTGLAIKIKHTSDGTTILFNPFAPSVLVRLLAMGLIPILILYFTSWKDMVNEFVAWAQGSQLLGRR